MELKLDRRLSNRRVYPAIEVSQSSTRKEELLMSEKELKRVWILRKLLNQMQVLDAMEFLSEKMKENDTNEEFLDAMNEPVL